MVLMQQYWRDTKDAQGALEKLTHNRSIEASLLQGLVKHGPKDLVNSLQAIPRNTRLMYVHAYQSYVWNFMVSRRLKVQFTLHVTEFNIYCYCTFMYHVVIFCELIG